MAIINFRKKSIAAQSIGQRGLCMEIIVYNNKNKLGCQAIMTDRMRMSAVDPLEMAKIELERAWKKVFK